ncbi:MAG: GTPase HflX [Thermoguttaceae bacterium]|nr:GTPase HflX [Thermoguttaceae bacterium]
MKRQNGPKNPGQRDRDIDKSARSPAAARPRRRNLGNDPEETHGEASPFSQTPWSTERFDASTHTDQLARTESNFGETAVLVGVYAPKAPPSSTPLAELAGLAKAAGVLPAAELIQRREHPDITTCIGRGKVDELRLLIERTGADVVLFDRDLLPAQTRNLEQALKVKVIDRTELILDIFASRAQTYEARLAVELAQLEYSLPRLKRMWTHLERQAGGGVGLRGPGEKQLEVDRRIAQKRIAALKKELDEIHQRKKREVHGRTAVRTVCLVGYTNAGKSTLLNRLTDSNVFVKDLLFATLDTRTRRWFLPGWGPVLLSDTVGFIRDLPHHLVASFRATLEEATEADLLIHVADAGNPEVITQIESAVKVLRTLGIDEKETLLVLNKTDTIDDPDILSRLTERYPLAVTLSAKDGTGVEKLRQAAGELLSREFLELTITAPIADGRLGAMLAREGEVLWRDYDAEQSLGIFRVRVPRPLLGRLREIPGITITGENLPDETVNDGF